MNTYRTQHSTIAVVVVEDTDPIRTAYQLILDGTPGMACVAAFSDAESCLAADLGRVDVILLDIGLPGLSGIDAIPQLREKWARADILMQTVYQDEGRIFKALCRGATGYLLKNTPPSDLIAAIQEVAAGGAPMSASIARQVVQFLRKPTIKTEALSEREEEVLDLLIEGKTNRQIGEALFVSTNTVAFHIKKIYAKLHVNSRAEAVAKALQRRG